MECCLCEAVFADDDWNGLAWHIAKAHAGFSPGPSDPCVSLTTAGWVNCWCWWTGPVEPFFGEHLRCHDGMAAHLLDYLFDQEIPF